MSANDALIDEIIKLKLHLRDLFLQHYTSYELFSWVWWLGIACIIIPSIIWWKVVDKKRILEICIYGFFVNVCATFLDVLGSEMVLWEYPIHIFPQIPLLLPVDFVILPAFNMIVYQKYPPWGKFLLASGIIAAILSFGVEPFAIWIGEYKLITWRLIYSFPIYLIIDVFAKTATDKMKRLQCVLYQER